MRPDDIVPLLTKKPIPGVGFRQGTVLAWDADTADNVVAVGGGQVSNLTVLSASEVKVIQPGDQVSILTLGKGAKSWFILGKVTVPGGAELAIVQSANYVPETSGYSVNRDGSAEFQDITARGDVVVNSLLAGTPGAARVELTPDNFLQVYDVDNQLVALLDDDGLAVQNPDNLSLVHIEPNFAGVGAAISLLPAPPSVGSLTSFASIVAQTNADRSQLGINSAQVSGQPVAAIHLFSAHSANPNAEILLNAGVVSIGGDLVVGGRIIPPYRATVTTDQVSTANNTTLFDVTALTMPVDANTVYRFKLYLLYTATTVADFKMALTGPSGADLSRWWFSCINATGAAASGPAGAGGAVGMGASGTSTPAFFIGDGTIAIGGTAGTVQVQAAKNTAEASTLTIRKGSYLELEPLT